MTSTAISSCAISEANAYVTWKCSREFIQKFALVP